MDMPAKRPPAPAVANYQPLQRYLSGRFADTVVLSFSQIEDLLGHPLPGPAYTEAAWWGNGPPAGASLPQSVAWTQAQRTVVVNLRSRSVEFTRV